MHCSASPKLCETTSAALWSSTHRVASSRSWSASDRATTRTIFAPGAITCAHSTSSEVSPAQPSAVSWSGAAERPVGVTTERLGSGSPHVASKSERSCAIVGLPYASTTAIVVPLPSR